MLTPSLRLVMATIIMRNIQLYPTKVIGEFRILQYEGGILLFLNTDNELMLRAHRHYSLC